MSTASAAASPFLTQQLGCLLAEDEQSHVSDLALRVAALFIILVGSMLGALSPVLLTRHAEARSGIHKLGTAFIHLLAPGIEALGNPCLSPGWHEYPYALGLCLSSIMGIFIIEVVSVSFGVQQRGKAEDCTTSPNQDLDMAESAAEAREANNHPCASVIGIAILEFGAILHSVLIGLTLAVAPKFKVLFTVLVTHQVFEGLGIGSRLASVRFSARYSHLPIVGAVVFGCSTPLGMAVGLAMHATYNTDDPGALVVSGILDSLSSGILMHTALVELLGREILFNEELVNGPAKQLVLAVGWVLLGCGVMALLGKWV
ncbi:Zinc/iron permease [Mycena galopus ATCC 62051]|nr:Zinc/iron permease [Mycena galopus ATCC 62051]